MKAVIQRVRYANVKVDEEVIGEIEKGFLVLLGVRQRGCDRRPRIFSEKNHGT